MIESSSDAAESAKQKVAACEKEISSIKAKLRELGPADEDNSDNSNSLTVAWIKVYIYSRQCGASVVY